MPESLLLDELELELVAELGVAVGVALVLVLAEPVLAAELVPVLALVLAAELVPALVLGVVVVVVPEDPVASAVLATPEMRPTVTAAADTVATPAAIRPRIRRRFGVSVGFIPTTMLRSASGGRQYNVKS